MSTLYLADGQGTLELANEQPKVPFVKKVRADIAISFNGTSDVAQISNGEIERSEEVPFNEESSGSA